MSETQCIRVLLRKTTFGGSTSLLFSVEGTYKPKRKVESLSFSYVFDKEIGCFDYGHCHSLNMTNAGSNWQSKLLAKH